MSTPEAPDISQLSPRQKAAIGMIAVGREAAAAIMAHMPETEVEPLVVEISRLRHVDASVAQAVLEELHETLLAQHYLREGGLEYAMQLLSEVKGERAAEIIARLHATATASPFAFLTNAEPDALIQQLRDERAQTVALVLSYLPNSLSAKVLSGLDVDHRQDVAHRLATIGRPSSDVVKRVEALMRRKIGTITSSAGGERTSGVSELAEMLNSVDRATERSILDGIAAIDPELADEIRQLMFIFEDLTLLSDRDLQEVLRQVEVQTLAYAVKGVKSDVQDAVMRNLSERARENLLEEAELLGAVRRKDVEEAQNQVIQVIRRMEEAQEITIVRGGAEEFVQ